MIATMTAASQIALMAAQSLPDPTTEAEVPEWVHLLPSGSIATFDARGPYEVASLQGVIDRSFKDADRLPIDENHAIDLVARQGGPSPARGWIVAMEARSDGIWGRVEWTKAGRELMADRAYRAISPVIFHTEAKHVVKIARASLVNRPNLRGLAALNQEEGMESLLERLADLLGLEADEDKIVGHVSSLHAARDDGDSGTLVALQSSMSSIGTALGLSADAGPADIVVAAQTKGNNEATIASLQSELNSLGEKFNALEADGKLSAAQTFVDNAIAEGRVGVKAQRTHYIAMHQENPTRTEEIIGAMPAIGGTTITAPATDGGEIMSLNASQKDAARLIGVSEDAYLKQLQAEHETEKGNV